MCELEISLGSIPGSFLSYIACLKEEEELCLCCQSESMTIPAPLVSSSG